MMLNPEGIPLGANGTEAAPDPNAALRFEDLTIDDDLSLLDRVVRYVRSGIALQRLVHVKMIAETAKSVGTASTINALLPLLPPLIADSESIIRQHLASQLLPLCLTCLFGDDEHFDPHDRSKATTSNRIYNQEGYTIATIKIVAHINKLITDPDMDVRKAASDALATLALYIKSSDIPSCILSIPLRLVHTNNNIHNPDDKSQNNGRGGGGAPSNGNGSGGGGGGNGNDDFCITASNLLADIASLDSYQVPPSMVRQHITPTIMALCKHTSFRVRRAAVQALPRLVCGSSMEDVQEKLIPCFLRLSRDDTYRVRKSVGECLVDMSRSLMLLPSTLIRSQEWSSSSSSSSPHTHTHTPTVRSGNRNIDLQALKESLQELRRKNLIPICCRLLQDSHKVVRHGMMQFLGPFIASFYPLEGDGHSPEDNDGIVHILGGKEAENAVGGMGVQFFPHANGMVSRLNPDNITAPVAKKGDPPMPRSELPIDSIEFLESHLPTFLEKCHNDAKSLVRILHHRENYPVPAKDIAAVQEMLLPAYVQLANTNTGDDNVDAEMRVYCAYSLPAVVLLLGKNGWDTSLKACFFKLITGSSTGTGLSNSKGGQQDSSSSSGASFVPLPVKRCLASSFHTMCNMIGSASMKATPEEKANNLDLLAIFEMHFLRDADDTVRLNVIRNLPSFLSLLSFGKRSKYLPVLYEIIKGDNMLASKRKNALNPILLNWRQRDMIAQILPNLIVLFRADQVRQYLWPILKILLSDSVNIVRENVEWSIPILLRCYDINNCSVGGASGDGSGVSDISAASKFCRAACNEVFMFLKATLLDSSNNKTSSSPTSVHVKSPSSSGAFSKRQSYCRILTAVALILRLNSDNNNNNNREDDSANKPNYPPHPFYTLSSAEYTHMHQFLKQVLLPPALAMKEDKVTNVRLTLAKCLRVMPLDIRDKGEVIVVLRTLDDEIQTWEGGGGQNMDTDVPATNNKIKISGMSMTGGSTVDIKPAKASSSSDGATGTGVSVYSGGGGGESNEISANGNQDGSSRVSSSSSSRQNDEDSSSLASI